MMKHVLSDPQTSGGLLIAVDSRDAHKVEALIQKYIPEISAIPIGRCIAHASQSIRIRVL